MLLVAEVALSLILLIGAGLMIRNVWQLLHIDLGFNPRNLIAMTINLPEVSYCNYGPDEDFTAIFRRDDGGIGRT